MTLLKLGCVFANNYNVEIIEMIFFFFLSLIIFHHIVSLDKEPEKNEQYQLLPQGNARL